LKNPSQWGTLCEVFLKNSNEEFLMGYFTGNIKAITNTQPRLGNAGLSETNFFPTKQMVNSDGVLYRRRPIRSKKLARNDIIINPML
jgi:hypothetical protein